MTKIFFDIETKSFADLPEVGAWRYAEDASTDIICLAYAVNDGPVKTWEPGQPGPVEFIDPETVFIARNALFEYAISVNVLVKKYGFPLRMKDPNNYICTAALSRMHGLPASLEPCAEYINKTHKKLPDGKRLIQLYSKPVKDKTTGALSFRPVPAEDMQKFLDYNIEDVESDRECYTTLEKLPNVRLERGAFVHDLTMNAEGVRIDTEALDKVLAVFDAATTRAEAAQESHGVNVRSPKQLKDWLLGKGYDIPDTKIDTIETLYDETQDSDVKEVLALRMFLGKASVKKYAALKDRVSPDGRLRYFMRYHGAHTGRYSSEGFQLHNLPKSKANADKIDELVEGIDAITDFPALIDAGKKILPGLILPDSGHVFLLGDFAAIEARGIAYLAGCRQLLEQFAAGKDIYTEMAKRINPASPNRQLGKAVILGCGYGMGINKFHDTCMKWGIDVDANTTAQAVKTYRSQYEEIPAFWYALERAFRECWTTRRPQSVGKFTAMERGSNFIKIVLPSGRRMFYHQVQIDPKTNDLSHFSFARKMRVHVYGGVLAENVTQAMCRDILVDRIMEIEKRGIKVKMHVHDEAVAQVPLEKVVDKQKEFDEIMNTAPAWLPGFPLKTESEVSRRYHK